MVTLLWLAVQGSEMVCGCVAARPVSVRMAQACLSEKVEWSLRTLACSTGHVVLMCATSCGSLECFPVPVDIVYLVHDVMVM